MQQPDPFIPAAETGYILEEDQPQPCPQCSRQRVRGVNGSRRCLTEPG
jgi:hypothetical protein